MPLLSISANRRAIPARKEHHLNTGCSVTSPWHLFKLLRTNEAARITKKNNGVIPPTHPARALRDRESSARRLVFCDVITFFMLTDVILKTQGARKKEAPMGTKKKE